MKFPQKYRCLEKNTFKNGNYKLVPIRYNDRLEIMTWRNEQVYHLRQEKLLSKENQNIYFKNIIENLFKENKPNQILFSYLENEICIGYGGLVHINWIDKNAEISFVMKTELENTNFEFHWNSYLNLIEQVAFSEIKLHKIFTYAFDIRPYLYTILEKNGYKKEATLTEHCFFENKYIDVIIHEKRNNKQIRKVNNKDAKLIFQWANERSVRLNSINQTKIQWTSHIKWFKNKNLDPNTKWFILEDCCNQIGQIRFDKNIKDNYWLISFSLDFKYRGKGFGKLILEETMILMNGYNFRALVHKDNIASKNIFEKLKFKLSKNKIETHFLEYKYDYNA